MQAATPEGSRSSVHEVSPVHKVLALAVRAEYRAYVNLDEKETNGLYFMDFSDKLKLRCVIVGEQSSVTRADVVGALEGIETGITVFKARAGFRAFEVVRNKKESMWS